MDQQEQQLINRIKQAQNILVTVSTSPSVDQLSAAIGLTVALNKLDKHGTAVFSGDIPDTIEFLKPEDTLEKNTNSLRDFIIALDKSKADKLRYKVEDQVVRIFITPYRTSLSQDDLEFSQGDFNVDVVIGLGVSNQQDIDAAISAHGRILHDATVASISLVGQGDLGTINWINTDASSLSEMMLGLIDGLDKKLLDNQIATALLTGIVASTDRFRNEKTSPKTMSASAELMAAGANPQLIASELEPQPAPPQPAKRQQREPDEPVAPRKADPGELDIEHVPGEQPTRKERRDERATPKALRPNIEAFSKLPDIPDERSDNYVQEPVDTKPKPPQVTVDYDGRLSPTAQPQAPLLPPISQVHGVESDGLADDPGVPQVRRQRMTSPPSIGDVDITANTTPEDLEPPTEELTLPAVNSPLLTHNETVLPPAPAPKPVESPFIPQAPLQPAPSTWTPPAFTPLPSSPMSAPADTLAQMPTRPLMSASAMPEPTPSFTPPPLAPMPTPAPMSAPFSPASASMIPGETLEEIEEAVHSSHLQPPADNASSDSSLDDARNAVQAALSSSSAPAPERPQPIAALNAQPLGDELRQSSMPAVPNNGFSEPTPGDTPADATLDMPLPSNPFGPGQQTGLSAPVSTFPGVPVSQPAGSTGAPPVPPPFVPPLP